MTNDIEKKEDNLMSAEFDVNGQVVQLTADTVKNVLANGNKKITDQEISMFIALCKYQHLNPFLNEAYLVKYGDKPAQNIVSKDAFMKRAEANPQYDGLKAGCIVQRDNKAHYTKGAFTLPSDRVLGGWAEVYRKDRKEPTHIEISSQEFSKGQATWNQMPANMIRKTAIVNALREAFPQDLGAMYTEDDADVSQGIPSNNDHEAPEQSKKSIDDLVGNVEEKHEEDTKTAKDVTPEPKPSEQDNSMSEEEARRAYSEIKNGGIDEDAETEYKPEEKNDIEQQKLL